MAWKRLCINAFTLLVVIFTSDIDVHTVCCHLFACRCVYILYIIFILYGCENIELHKWR